jgi:TRAP-type mannitol/chloroaromatic compound transport system permease small subunit
MSQDPAVPNPEAPPERHVSEGEITNRLDAAVEWVGKGFSWLVFISMLISVAEVISRYVFDSPTSWVHETTVFLIAVMFSLGGPVALARNKHIRVRILYDTVGPKFRNWLNVLNEIIALGFCAGMSFAAFTLFWRSSHDPFGAWTVERSGTSWNPPFPTLTKGVITFALIVMTVQTIIHLVQAIQAVSNSKKEA